jgi:ketosteroid isomerase-like protein
MNTALETTKAFFDAIERQDWPQLEALCTPDFKAWHCYDPDHELSLSWVLAMLPMLYKAIPNMRYAKRRYSIGEGSVMQQHCIEGTTHDGRPVCVHVSMQLHVNEQGRCWRLEEFADSAQLDQLRDAVARLGQSIPVHS